MLSVLLVAPVVVAAWRADGFDRTKVNLHDAGVWVVWQGSGLIGRINTETEQVEVKLAALGRDDEIGQHGLDLVAFTPSDGRASVVDTGVGQAVGTSELPSGSDVQVGGGAAGPVVGAEPPLVASVTAPDGRVWLTGADALHNLKVEVDEPTYEAGDGARTALDESGVAHVYQPDDESVTLVGSRGVLGTEPAMASERPAVTTVGHRTVVADLDSRRIGLPGGQVVDLSAHSAAIALQRPGPAGDAVLVATDRSLLSIDLSDGTRTAVHEGVNGGVVAPVRVDGCDHGAWSGTSPASIRRCDDQPVEVTAPELMQKITAQDVLVFQVNRDRVVLNGLASGVNLLFTPDDPVVVEDWSQAQSEDPPVDQETVEISNEEEECKAVPDPPRITGEIEPIGTRAGRTVVVPVLDEISLETDPCDVVVLDLPKGTSFGDNRVDIIEDGTALQVTTASDASGEVSVPYSLQGRNAVANGTLRLRIHDERSNTAPVPVPDETSLILGPNRSSVKHDVLANDLDPEGDHLTLVNAVPDGSARDVQVTFQASGLIEVMAGSSATGDQKILYYVQDDRGFDAEVPGELMVRIQPRAENSPPTARADRLTAAVGESVTVDLLENDSDLDGDPMTLAQVDPPASIEMSDLRSDAGEVTFTPTSGAGNPVFFSYLVKDDSADPPVEGMVRIDVLPEGTRREPIAVLDDVVARPGSAAVVDLTKNDVGDGVLAVTSIEADSDGSQVEIELLDLHVARVTASAGFTDAESYTYVLEDGAGASRAGQLLIRPHWADVHNLPPVTSPDEVSLRAGTATSVAVLANDLDPEGEQLSVVSTLRPDQLPADPQLQAFVMYDQVHVVAASGASGTHRVGYTASDPEEGSTQDDSILVRIVGADEPNRPPRDPHLRGRVRAGSSTTLRVPLVGLDPDGDVVAVTGLESPPRLGTVSFDQGSLRYDADPDASGADEFSFRLDDGRGGVTLARVEVVVLARSTSNGPPVAVLDQVAVAPGGARTIDVLNNDTDPDGDPLTILTQGVDEISQPRYGTVRLVEGRVEYVQDRGSPDVGGGLVVLDGFTYGIGDGNGNIARGQVAVEIRAEVPQVPPAARDDLHAPVAVGDEVAIDVLANDFDPDDPTMDVTVELPELARVSGESGATITLDGGTVTVVVAEDEPRSVVLPYRVVDRDGLVGEALVVVPVMADLPPIARPDEASVDGGESITIDVLANDRDPEQPRDGTGLQVVRVAGDRGAVEVGPTGDGSAVTFTADPDAQGAGGFSYQVEDEAGNRTWGRVLVEITGQNFEPTLREGTVTVSAGGETTLALDGLAEDRNPSDVPRLTFEVGRSSDPLIGVATTGDRQQTLVVDAAVDANGAAATVPVTVSDTSGATAEATVAIVVSPFQGRPPSALADASRTIQDRAVTLAVVDNDDPGLAGPVTVAADDDPTSASGQVGVSGDRRSLTFTPNPGFHGEAAIRYTVEDATGERERRSTAIWTVTVVGRPSPPLSPTGDPDDAKVYLSWRAPMANGAPITGYEVRANGPGGRTDVIGHPATSYTFDGLQNDRAYTFEVRALNEATAAGTTEDNWSPPSVPYTPDVVPEPPGMPQLTFGDGQIDVTWAAAATRGSPVSAYQLEISGPDVNRTEVLGPVTSHRWAGLTNGSTYRFRVRAVNNRGEGSWSVLSDANSAGAVPAGQPLAPTRVTATPGDQQSAGGVVQVDWDWTRAGQGNGAEAEAFVVAYTPVSGSASAGSVTLESASVRSHAFTGLRNGVTYRFDVRVRTKAGPSDVASHVARPSKRPTPVAGPVTASNADRAATVSFGPSPADAAGPGDGGDPENFEYRITTIPARAGGVLRTTSTSVRVDGLSNSVSNGGSYVIQVQACNANGCAEARQVDGVRPFGPPGVPSVNPSRDGGTARWEWGAVGANGRPIRGYEVRVGDGGWSLQAERSVSRSISPGQTIRVCVRTVGDGDTPQSAAVRSGESCHNVSRTEPRARVVRSANRASVPGCDTASCYRVRLILTDVQPGRYAFVCHNGSYTFHFDVTGSSYDSDMFQTPGQYCVTGRNINFTHRVSGPSGTVDLSGRADGGSNYDVSRPF